MKILVIDIETRPNLAHVWGLWDQRVGLNQIVEVGTVICFAAKWHKSSKVEFASDYHDGHDAMVKRAWTLLEDADAVVHYNGKAFDMKHLQREFLLAGLPPPSPWVDIDLLLTVRQQFKFASNKLDHIASELGIGTKMAHEGFDLWRKCMADDKAAWGRMKRYNVQDVRLTETLYDRLMPWIKSHPNRALYDSRPDTCPKCGGSSLHARGTHKTKTRAYRRFQCQDCGSWCTETQAELHTDPGVKP